jgi:pyridinium-3,5-bisthiocarboxylic acid mononucleotide nickel chelatase
MKIAYFDCFSGVSGDMILGALVDAGLSLEDLKTSLSHLPIRGYTIKARTVHKGDLRATKVDVITDSSIARSKLKLKSLGDLEKIILRSRMNASCRQRGLMVLKRLFEAEARAHGISAKRLRPHGMDPIDTLVDIVGTVAGLEQLGIGEVMSSPIHVGHGIKGLAPATAELLKRIPIYSSAIPNELTTPTGAALLTALAKDFCPTPPLTLHEVGYGAGTQNLAQGPNLLRVLIGEPFAAGHSYETDRVIQLETNIDDLSPQIYEHLMERMLAAGALDIYFIPIIMKKGRPATKVSVLSPYPKGQDLLNLLFQETTTLGIRISEVTRAKLMRSEKEISTRFGKVRVKVTERHGKMDIIPEYHDCKTIAQRTGLPLRTVLEEVRNTALKRERRP